ncbi:hypothetical protein GA0070214_102224 [Micromonospora chaiyaphumensis]|uniref:Uncharacterized protein n=1 Tax=Micromonospora chaiyaphumensis TaxID=307119 RepID=A0A1C4VBV0_9ACTN|nr:hypothetical protein GA0070214_102224 [Micromonospora chaiyaphumensis]
MWACLQDQDTTGQWKQVAGWRKVCDLALAHVSRLREYRRGLAEAWPPETNAAARAYLGELDQLIDQVQRTHDAAAANYDALAAATRAIGSTRAELKPLFDEYAEKVRQKRAYEAVLTDPKAVAGSRLPEKPPVTDTDLEELNVRARGLMTGLSGELQQAQVMLQRPPTPIRPGRQTNDPDVYGNAAPLIPPIIPMPVATSGGTSSPTRSPTAATQAGSPSMSPANLPSLGVGPVLGGVGSGLTPAPTQPTLPNTAPPSPPTGVAAHPAVPPITGIGRTPSVRRDGPAVPPDLRTNEPKNGTSRSTPPSTSRPLPSNGLIGLPGGGGGQPVNPNPPRRINPVGGVIGGGSAGTAPSGAAGSRPGGGRNAQFNGVHNSFPIGGSPSAISGHSPHRRPEREAQSPRPWDPDNPWETAQGVTPVMLPPEEDGPIDPGPAIGFDR